MSSEALQDGLDRGAHAAERVSVGIERLGVKLPPVQLQVQRDHQQRLHTHGLCRVVRASQRIHPAALDLCHEVGKLGGRDRCQVALAGLEMNHDKDRKNKLTFNNECVIE